MQHWKREKVAQVYEESRHAGEGSIDTTERPIIADTFDPLLTHTTPLFLHFYLKPGMYEAQILLALYFKPLTDPSRWHDPSD